MKRRRRLVAVIVVFAVAAVALMVDQEFVPRLIRAARSGGADGVFEVKPYLQLGDAPALDAHGLESATLLWQAGDVDAAWNVDVRAKPDGPWVEAKPPTRKRVAVDGVAPFRLYRTELTGLVPGQSFAYRVRHAEKVVFEAKGTARKPAGTPHRFVVFGDCAAGTAAQSAVAYQTFVAKPDYVVVTGDIVYMRGRVSEYLDHFFPVYNDDSPSPRWGAPLLRSVPFVTAPGNHDLIERGLDTFPDGLAYFYYWAQPLNGPVGAPGASGFPGVRGTAARQKAFLDAAGSAYPRMANFSFDYGDVHWTVLDANPYADWTDPALHAWLEADLARAKSSAWRIVAFHHPPFSSSKAHYDDQRLRVLVPTLERGGVSIVFNGHVHNYQRSYPLRFEPGNIASPYGPTGHVDGRISIDTAFDGKTHTVPQGVIYIVTGAGGARLYNVEQTANPTSWQSYTARFVSDTHSLTVVDVTADALSVRQISVNGAELDRFRITRAVPPSSR